VDRGVRAKGPLLATPAAVTHDVMSLTPWQMYFFAKFVTDYIFLQNRDKINIYKKEEVRIFHGGFQKRAGRPGLLLPPPLAFAREAGTGRGRSCRNRASSPPSSSNSIALPSAPLPALASIPARRGRGGAIAEGGGERGGSHGGRSGRASVPQS
jgi:hypothetical protein